MNRENIEINIKEKNLYHVLRDCYVQNLSSDDAVNKAKAFISKSSPLTSVNLFYLERSLESDFIEQSDYDSLLDFINNDSIYPVDEPALVAESIGSAWSQKLFHSEVAPTQNNIEEDGDDDDFNVVADDKIIDYKFKNSVNNAKSNLVHNDVHINKDIELTVSQARDDNQHIGLTIKKRFLLEENIGSGVMGSVYRARDLSKESLGEGLSEVAVKILNENIRNQKDLLLSLQREVFKTQALIHPSILTVNDFDRDGDIVFMSMEYLRGNTLDELVSELFVINLPKKKIVGIIELIAEALALAHKKDFIHGDLNLSNVMLTNDGDIKVLNFGFIQAISDFYGDPSIPHDHQIYASPEKLEGKTPNSADDIYALGCLAYTLLSGRHPFMDDENNKINSQEARDKNVKIEKISNVSKRHMNAIQKSLDFNRINRFQNAEEFLYSFKSPFKFRRLLLLSSLILMTLAFAYWWFAFEQSTSVYNLNDLPDEMSEFVSTINIADQRFDIGDVDRAHSLYSQVWEASFNSETYDQIKLKVILDQRVDTIIEFLIDEAKNPNNSEFRNQQLKVALEFLKQDELGTIDKKIDATLKMLRKK